MNTGNATTPEVKPARKSTIKLDTRLEEKAKVARKDEMLDWITETDMETIYE